MDLRLTAEQRTFVDAADRQLARLCPIEHVRAMDTDARGFDPDRWLAIVDLGWPDVEDAGLGFFGVALLLERMGAALLPSPFLASAVVARPFWNAPGAIATLALAEPGWRDLGGTPVITASGGGETVRLTGTKRFVGFAPDADAIVVVTSRDQAAIVVRDAAGMTSRRLATLGGDALYDVTFADTPATPLPVEPGRLDRALDRGAVGALAYAVGTADRALAMTIDYAKTRQQFGRPIGSFQAVAHRCVDMRTDLDALRLLVYQAAWAIDTGRDVDLAIGAARTFGGPALQRLFVHAHQVHGAIGFSTEHDLHLFTRRAKATELFWGPAAPQRDRVARVMGL